MAQEVAPETQKLIVYVIPTEGARTASELADRVPSDDTLRAELGSPLSARPTVQLPPLPAALVADPEGPRARLQRYLTLEYPAGTDVTVLRDQLRADARFGYVDVDRGGGLSAEPLDDFYKPILYPTNPEAQEWFYEQVDLERAWDYGKGYATVGAADTGIEVGHPDLQENLVLHHSWDFRDGDDDPSETSSPRGHGTHVAGLLAADTDNVSGVAGSCWNCSLMMTRALRTSDRIDAFSWMAGNGAQILNLSGFEPGNAGSLPGGTPCTSTPPAQQHPFCSLLEILEQREIVFSVSSGNDLRRINFPANEPTTIAVGGTERDGDVWDDRDEVTGCPDLEDPNSGSLFQCGSNIGPEQDFAAPARQILSTFLHGWAHVPAGGCSDDPNNPNTFDFSGSTATLGYDYCTGTSMSAPLVSGIFAQLRSHNPLLTVAETKQALVETTAQAGSHNPQLGFGIPQAGAAVERVLGTVDGQQVASRLTPMFALFSSTATNFLYTSKPQVATAAVLGTLHELPDSTTTVSYSSASVGTSIDGYSDFPFDSGITGPTPVASFHVFTSDRNPFDASTPLVPLYRLSFTEDCDLRDHVYTTEQAGIDHFTGQGAVPDWCPNQPGNQVFRLDGIEGYILSECPPGFSCDDPADPSQPQCLHRRSSQVDFGWALVLESELGQPPYETYVHTNLNSCIGYVFPNGDTDNDGLTDGQELVLGTDPDTADSDCDGLVDGVEMPTADLSVSDPLDGVCVSPVVITDSFNSGGDGPLHGRPTETGGVHWVARAGAVTQGGRAYNSAALGRVPYDVRTLAAGRTVRLSGDIKPAHSEWAAMGFSSEADTLFWADGPLWVLLRPNGQYSAFAAGQLQSQGTTPGTPVDGYYTVELSYTQGSRKFGITISGVEVASGTFSEEPKIRFAGFHSYLGVEGNGKFDNFLLTDVTATPQVLIADSFAGSGPLDGRAAEQGGVVWTARPGAVVSWGRVLDASGIGGVPFDVGALGDGIATLSADLDPRVANWANLGFTRLPDGPFWSVGEFWVLLYRSGHYTIRAGGQVVQTGFVSGSPGRHRVELEYDTTTQKGSVTIDGALVFAQTLASVPDIQFASFHIVGSIEGATYVDNFEARFDPEP